MSPRLSFRHLEAIRAVIVTGSVTGAASRLHVTQPAVSHLIRDAEERIGFKLFDRRLGRLTPTQKAELLFVQIERSFMGLDAVNDFCMRLKEGDRRSIVIATIPVVATAIMPSVIKAYRNKIGPDFFLVRPCNSEIAISSARFQTADLAFGLNLEPVPGVESVVIGRYRALCFLPPKHPLGTKSVISPDDVADISMISLSQLEGIAQSVGLAMPDYDQSAKAVVECPSAMAAAAMVEALIGYTLLDPVTASLFRRSRIIFRPFEPVIPFTLRAYWARGSQPKFDRELLIDLARQCAADISAAFPGSSLAEITPGEA